MNKLKNCVSSCPLQVLAIIDLKKFIVGQIKVYRSRLCDGLYQRDKHAFKVISIYCEQFERVVFVIFLHLLTTNAGKTRLEARLTNMPLVVETPSQLRAKAELEFSLKDIDASISRFSRPKVYIRQSATSWVPSHLPT